VIREPRSGEKIQGSQKLKQKGERIILSGVSTYLGCRILLPHQAVEGEKEIDKQALSNRGGQGRELLYLLEWKTETKNVQKRLASCFSKKKKERTEEKPREPSRHSSRGDKKETTFQVAT